MTTKEKILSSSLELFALKGFESVRVEEIADKVGIKAPSLYKHFRSKKDIFVSLMEETVTRYESFLSTIMLERSDKAPDVESLLKRALDLFDYSLHDKTFSSFRRMLTIEQFRDERISELYSSLYWRRMIEYHTSLFSSLMEKGVMKKCDAESAALMYDSVFLALIGECDRDESKEKEARGALERHVRLFHSLFAPENQKNKESQL